MSTVTDWKGADELRTLLRPIESLHPHPDNPRRGDTAEILKSLQRFGQVRAILTDPEGTIIAGNHTYAAAVEAGWTEVAAVTHDFKSAEEARAYLLADNRLSEVGEYDRAELMLLLDELEATSGWTGTGYIPDDLGQLRALEELLNPSAPAEPTVAPSPPPEMREIVLLLTEEAALTDGLTGFDFPKPFARTVWKHDLPSLRAEHPRPGVVELGARREKFSGTDALSMSVQPRVTAWLEAELPPFVLAEGDRLANSRFYAAVLELGYTLRIARLRVSATVAEHRRTARAAELGTKLQAGPWLKGRITKVSRLAAEWEPWITDLDADQAPARVLAELVATGDPVATLLRSIP